MNKNITFGQYYPRDSLIHRLDPRTKLFCGLIAIIMAFVSNSYWCYLACYVYLITGVALSKIPPLQVLKTVKAVLAIVAVSVIINLFFYSDGNVLWQWWRLRITDGGLLYAGQMILRIMFLVISTSMITLTSTPTELTDGLELLLKPLNYIKVPVHDIAIIMSIALRFIPTLTEETEKIMMAQKARGAAFDHGNLFARAKALLPVLIPLFVSAFRRADELAFALDARCYSATEARTKMKVLRFRLSDLFSALVALLFLTLTVLLRLNLFGVL